VRGRLSWGQRRRGSAQAGDRSTYRLARVKELGTVAALEEEGFAEGDLREMRPQPRDLGRRDERRQSAELREDAAEWGDDRTRISRGRRNRRASIRSSTNLSSAASSG